MLLFLSTVVERVQALGTWQQQGIYVLMNVHERKRRHRISGFETNMWRIGSYVREGTLDFILIKPCDSPFLASTRFLRRSSLAFYCQV
ncbi:MAG: ABC-2 family transporter protein [Candidatus Zipacnadales bacterium]